MEYGGTLFVYRFYFRTKSCDSFTFLMWNVYFRWNFHLLNFAYRKTTKMCVFSIFYAICYYVRQLKQTTMFKWSGYESSQSHFYMFIVYIWNTRRYTHSIERSVVFSTWIVDLIIKVNTHIRTPMFKKNVLCIFLSVHDVDTFIYSLISACLTPETPLEKFMPTFHACRRYDFRKEYALQTFTMSYAIFYRQQISSCTFRGAFLTHHLFNSAELSEQSTFPYFDIDCLIIPSISDVSIYFAVVTNFPTGIDNTFETN